MKSTDVVVNRFAELNAVKSIGRIATVGARRVSCDKHVTWLFLLLQGYKKRDAFIVTQMPLPDTVVDFWTMIRDHSCRTIVMMNTLSSYTDDSQVYTDDIRLNQYSFRSIVWPVLDYVKPAIWCQYYLFTVDYIVYC